MVDIFGKLSGWGLTRGGNVWYAHAQTSLDY
jgi:hypothetical protein